MPTEKYIMLASLEIIIIDLNDFILYMGVDTVFCSGLKSKFSSIESCFGSGIHFPYNLNFQIRGPSAFSESVQFIFFCLF